MKRIRDGLLRLTVAITCSLPVFAARGPEDYQRIASDVVKLREIARIVERIDAGGGDRLRITLVGEIVEVDRTENQLGTAVRTIVIDYVVDRAARAAAEKKFRGGGAKTKRDADFAHEPDPPKLDAKREFWAHLAPAGGRLGNVNRYAGRIVNMEIDAFAGPVFVPVAGQYSWDQPQRQSPAAIAPAETFTGTVRTGIMAIGGETTGIVLATRAGDYELDVRGDRELAAKLETLNGKKIIVTGDYRPRRGVEVKERRIIIVREVRAAP
jgi:hypothetical protein